MGATRFSSLWAGLALFAVALLAGMPAQADIVYTSWTYDDDAGVNVNFSEGLSGSFEAGEFTFYNGTTDVANTWCVDIYHEIEGSGDFAETAPMQVGLTSSNILNGNGVALSWDTLGRMGFLANYYDSHTSFYKSSVQIAIWEIEYGTSVISQINGANNATVASQVVTLLADIGNNRDWDFYWLSQAGNQGQMLMCGDARGFACKNGDNPPSVPEPASLALLGAGLLGLTGIGILRRRRPPAV